MGGIGGISLSVGNVVGLATGCRYAGPKPRRACGAAMDAGAGCGPTSDKAIMDAASGLIPDNSQRLRQ